MANETLKHATAGEARCVRALVDRILKAGYTVSVCDDGFGDGEWTVKKSTDKAEILAALCTTGSDMLRMRDAEGNKVGWICLIWGNDPSGDELMADHADNETITKLVGG